MRVLWCRIFGHKFHIDSFIPDGGYERGVSGIIRDTGTTVRKETVYCTRCGIERAKLVEETRTIAQRTNGYAKPKMPTREELIPSLEGYGSNYKAGANAMYDSMCRHFGH